MRRKFEKRRPPTSKAEPKNPYSVKKVSDFKNPSFLDIFPPQADDEKPENRRLINVAHFSLGI